jgi:hypothetical protein
VILQGLSTDPDLVGPDKIQEMEQKEIEDQIEGEDVQLEQSSFFRSRTFMTILWAVGIVLILLLVFKAGEIVESQKADFAYRWSQNYYPNFVGRPSPGMDLGGNGFMVAHGVFGPIMGINAPGLVVQDMNSNVEKSVMTSTDTVIRDLNGNIPFSNLKVNEQVVVIGSPDNSGQIEARLIRVIPASSPPLLSPGRAQPQTQSQ